MYEAGDSVPDCMGDYDFEEIVKFAHKRFIEGVDTVRLLAAAKSQREREEIALVSLLNVDDGEITAIDLKCRHADFCRIKDCRQRLRGMLETRLGRRKRIAS